MKTTITALMLGLFLGATANAAELYNPNERILSFFGSYIDKHDGTVAPGASFSYFFTRHLGVSGATYWENWSGTFFDNVFAEGIFRWPLGELPLAPYGFFGFGYSFETEETFERVGAGAEWRFNEKWAAFGDLSWQFNNDTRDGVGVRLGVRLLF
jgi:hypothetical protein